MVHPDAVFDTGLWTEEVLAARAAHYGMSVEDKSIWFGILALMVVEIGLVHPPVGMNVYIINRLAKDVPLVETFKGVMPFLASDLVRIVLLVAFPSISLVLVKAFGAL